MRVGKLPVYSNATLVATPEDSTFDLIYRLSTDGVVYGKKSDGTSYAVGGNSFNVKGDIDCSANPNYPAAEQGDAYRVTVAGKIGGAAGKVCQVGDIIVAWADNAGGDEAAVGADWTVEQGNLEPAVFADFPANTTKYIVPSVLNSILRSLDLRAIAYVDPVNGDDATAMIGSILFPYKTIAAVEAVIGFTGLVYLFPGTYTDIGAGDVAGINTFYCERGVVFTPGDGNTTFSTTGKDLVVLGHAVWSGAGRAVHSNTGTQLIEFDQIALTDAIIATASINSSGCSVVIIKGKRLASISASAVAGINVSGATGKVTIEIDQASSNEANTGFISTDNCTGSTVINIGSLSGGVAAANSLLSLNASGTGHTSCKVGVITYTGGMGNAFMVGAGGANVIGNTDLEIGNLIVTGAAGGFCMINTEGKANVRIKEYSYAGADSDIVTINGAVGGECILEANIRTSVNGACVAANGAMKARLKGFFSNSGAGANAHGVAVYSANVPVAILDDVTTVIGAGGDSVFADAAMNVKVYKHFTNKALNVNVTEQAGASVVSVNVV